MSFNILGMWVCEAKLPRFSFSWFHFIHHLNHGRNCNIMYIATNLVVLWGRWKTGRGAITTSGSWRMKYFLFLDVLILCCCLAFRWQQKVWNCVMLGFLVVTSSHFDQFLLFPTQVFIFDPGAWLDLGLLTGWQFISWEHNRPLATQPGCCQHNDHHYLYFIQEQYQ